MGFTLDQSTVRILAATVASEVVSLGRKGLGVRNGDRGTVVAAHSNEISVQLDGTSAKIVTFAPKAYAAFDYANASTVHKSQGASVDAAVSVIDRSASAELLFVAVSRSKRELDIVVPRSAFAGITDLAQHVTDRISLKTTTRTYDELLKRTGGTQSIRVLNIESQRQALPMRRLYEADIVEPLHGLQARRIGEARVAYRERKREIDASTASMEERLDARRDALREMRSAVTATYRELRPQPFGQWLHDREERYERSRPWTQRQERVVEREHNREQSFVRAEELARSEHLDLEH
jgi:hypothetical protein